VRLLLNLSRLATRHSPLALVRTERAGSGSKVSSADRAIGFATVFVIVTPSRARRRFRARDRFRDRRRFCVFSCRRFAVFVIVDVFVIVIAFVIGRSQFS
jgi:hypothetical protein